MGEKWLIKQNSDFFDLCQNEVELVKHLQVGFWGWDFCGFLACV